MEGLRRSSGGLKANRRARLTAGRVLGSTQMAESVDVRPEITLFRISPERYHAMRDAGILGEDDRVELLDGLLVPKMTKRPPHRLATRLVREAVEAVVPPGFYVDSQEPITTADSEPEPDVCIVRGAPRDYDDRHPGSRDVPLVIEVADDSLETDRGVKLTIYARAMIPTYWVVNLRARMVEVYTEPLDDGYRQRTDHPMGDVVLLAIDGEVARIAVADLLP